MTFRTSASMVLLCAAVVGCGSPASFDECIRESMKGSTEKRPPREVIISCRKQFPAVDASAEPAQEEEPIERGRRYEGFGIAPL